MSNRIPEGFAEISFQYRLIGDPEPMFTSLGLSIGDDFEGDNAEDVRDAWQSEVAPFLTEDYLLGPGEITIGAEPEDFQFTIGGGTTPGLVGADATPQNSAYLVRKNTPFPGRRHSGRMYVPGVPETYVNANGMIDETILSNFFTALQNFAETALEVSNVNAFILFHNSAPFEPDEITLLNLSPRIATQRRRLRP